MRPVHLQACLQPALKWVPLLGRSCTRRSNQLAIMVGDSAHRSTYPIALRDGDDGVLRARGSSRGNCPNYQHRPPSKSGAPRSFVRVLTLEHAFCCFAFHQRRHMFRDRGRPLGPGVLCSVRRLCDHLLH